MDYTSLKRTVAPASEPVSLAEAKAALRLDGTADDSLVGGLITAARESAENYTGRAFVTQTWRMVLPSFPCGTDRRIYLPKPPVQSVTSVTYVDSDGVTQALSPASYTFVDDGHCPYIVEAYGETWPSARAQDDAVTVTFVAGYSAVPEAIKTAITRQLQQNFDDLRPEDHAALDSLVCGLLYPYRVSLI